MSEKQDGGPAFPIPAVSGIHGTHTGMSLRDWFAGLVIGGMAARTNTTVSFAKIAYEIADAMLAERAKTG